MSFSDFCTMVHKVDPLASTPVLRSQFDAIDSNGDGVISAEEYIDQYLVTTVLWELSRQSHHLSDLFDDHAGITVGEFRSHVRALGAQSARLGAGNLAVQRCTDEDLDRVFAALDQDGSGTLCFHELCANLHTILAHDEHGRHLAIRTRLRGRAAKRSGSALPSSTVIRAGEDALQQLRALLRVHLQTVINLFREWDANGDVRLPRHSATELCAPAERSYRASIQV